MNWKETSQNVLFALNSVTLSGPDVSSKYNVPFIQYIVKVGKRKAKEYYILFGHPNKHTSKYCSGAGEIE